ncbi:MAG: hypothetical protein MJY68_00015 [Bacteroidaceae bacterium]|nr:hypothetical protein [Bacteroidaceae bacterium]
MNTKHLSLAFAAAAALLAGCAKSPIEEVKTSEQFTDLELAYVGATETKAAIDGTNFPEDGEIGLFLFKDQAATTPYGQSGYTNVKYSYNSNKSKWTADPSIKVGSTPGYLYGYYPYKADTQEQPINVKAIPVASSLNGDDVMYASHQEQPITDLTAANTSITMNHALARVTITVTNNGYIGKAELSKIKFSGAKIAQEGTLNALDGKITATNSDVTLDVPTANQTITVTGTTYECLLVPSEKEESKQTVKLTLTIDGIDKVATLSGNNGVIIAQNTKSNITITLSNKGISVQTVSVENWNVVEVGGHKVTIAVAEGVDPNDILTKAYVDGNNVVIRAFSETGQHLKCTLSEGTFCPQSKTDKLVYTFTLSNIESDVTATIGYAKPLTVTALSNNTALGTASFEGECYEGENITFTATAAGAEYKFVEWQDADGKKLSTDNPYSVTLASDLNVKAIFKGSIYGTLPGVFTVDDGNPKKTIQFSKGNLYWGGNKYDFESKQYEFKDSWDVNHVSHFYWSKTASVAYAKEYSDSGQSINDVFFTNDANFKVGNAPAGAYKSLSKEEWTYLLESRSASTVGETANARYAKATIKVDESTSVTGLILFPDVFTVPESVNTPSGINTKNAGFDTNTYSVADWGKLESAGAVFLPAAGHRNDGNDYVSSVGSNARYWSSSPLKDKAANAIYLSFFSGTIDCNTNGPRSYAFCVRLVTDAI